MINLIFQRNKAKNPDDVWVDCRGFFSEHKKVEWFQDKFVQQIISEIDHAKVKEGFVIESREGIAIPPEYLCTGTKTAICIYEFPNLIFNLTQLGNNVMHFITQLSMERNFTALTYREIPARFLRDCGFTKDYQEVSYEDNIEYYDLFREWLEEIYND